MHLELKSPIQFGSREITDLTFREPRAKDMRHIKREMTVGDMLDMAAKLCGEPGSVIDLLTIDDANAVIEFVAKSFSNGGSTS